MRTVRQRAGQLFLFVVLLTPALQAQTSVPAPAPIVDANSRFAFKLFKQLATKTPDHNILVAPTGLSLTFGLLDNGSDPQTRKEIESAFEFTGMDLAEINEGFAALRKEMYLVPPPPQKNGTRGASSALWADNPNRLVIADSLWIKHGYFGKQFLNASRSHYGLDLRVLLPDSNPSVQVSRWASKQVHRNVPISMGTMARNDFFLVDVTRFHSFWRHNFESTMTRPTPFTLPSGQKKEVPMMYQQRNFDYIEGQKFQAVVLPYGQNASMYVFLPAESYSLKELEQTLTAKNWQEWLSHFDSREGMVGLPKFKAETGFDVRAALQELGVKRIFEQFAALRPAVTIPEGARLTNALQKTELSVDEKGTEAISVGIGAGVPGGVMGGLPGQERPKPFVMIVNRPFFFAIRHNPTGQLLFLGAVAEP
jgi:serine protease inhibitor